TLEDMIPFAKAVVRAAKRAVVNVDLPTATCKGGPREVAKAARRLKDEVGADMTKVDIREQEEELFDDVQAVVDTGLAVYPQLGFPAGPASTGLHGTPADREHILKWAHKLEDAGAKMIDLTSVSIEIYTQVCKELKIPVIGGQTGPEADGRIYVSYSIAGYEARALDQAGGPSAAKTIFEIMKNGVDAIHSGQWER
ncbi:MAG: hypothetical protein GTO40_22980, partial [Deltaproteobacteria bacterium]|nr:hypothetical protein [Deltaproteobacteria bacterium]